MKGVSPQSERLVGNAEKTAQKTQCSVSSDLSPESASTSATTFPIVDSVLVCTVEARPSFKDQSLSLRRRVSFRCNYVLMRCVIVMLMKALVGKC